MGKNDKPESKTGFGKTTETKKAGRIKKTDVDFDKAYDAYKERVEIRIKNGEEIKVLDREAWNKSKPSGETSSEIFVRLTKARMPKMLKSFDNISALAKYKHVDTQSEKIITDLTKAVEMVKLTFSAKSETKEEKQEYQI